MKPHVKMENAQAVVLVAVSYRRSTNNLMNKVFIGAGLVATLFAGFVGYSFYQNLVVIPKTELAYKMFLEQKKEENYKNCLLKADEAYDYNWNAQCEAQGKADNCLLPRYVSDGVNDSWAENKKNCVTMYK